MRCHATVPSLRYHIENVTIIIVAFCAISFTVVIVVVDVNVAVVTRRAVGKRKAQASQAVDGGGDCSVVG